jgi:hypothetical protein
MKTAAYMSYRSAAELDYDNHPDDNEPKFESDTLDEAYYDRNQAAMLAAKLARELGYETGWRVNEDDPDWPILFIELPTGQVSWHIPMAEALDHNVVMHRQPQPWDGHDLEEKRHRILQYVMD